MKLHSTLSSVEAGELSLLSIVETIVAVGISILIVYKLGTLKWVAISAAIAPFLLLRTDSSTKMGVNLFQNFLALVEGYINPLLTFPVIAAGAICVRVYATIICSIRQPIETLRSLPSNWSRVALSEDFVHPPELVAGYNTQGSNAHLKYGNFPATLWEDFKSGSFPLRVIVVLLGLPFLILLYAPPYMYRLSLKSTSLFYSPMLWILVTTFRKIRDIPSELNLIRNSDVTKIVLVYSSIILVGFSVKIILMMAYTDFAQWWESSTFGIMLGVYVVPMEIPIWQLVAAINSILAIVLYLFVGAALMRYQSPDTWKDATTEKILRSFSLFRSVLTVYTMSCIFYITVTASSQWNWPHLGTKFFPWE